MVVATLALFFFSSYLMLHTFSYNPTTHEMLIASRVWSDFGAHIPLIRSFSLGHNWPPEYPIFPGEKIRYHFLFYAVVGVVEHLGVRIDWALNTASILGFFFLLIMIYTFASFLFQQKKIAILSVLFFLFNGSLSFLEFFKAHPLGITTLQDVTSLNQFPSFGPWDERLVTAFTNLNIYTNQRHLGLSFALVIFILYTVLKYEAIMSFLIKHIPHRLHPIKKSFLSLLPALPIGLCVASLLFLNHPSLLITLIFCAYLFIFHPQTRKPLFVVLIVTLPFVRYFFHIAQPGGTPAWETGYLSPKPFTWTNFFEFWVHNLGLHILFMLLGFFVAPKRYRFLFIPLIILFILPNIFRFSVDMINNHKFINFFTIIGNIYSAAAFVALWNILSKHLKKLKKKILLGFLALKITSIIFFSFLFLSLTLSGILDFFVVRNDYLIVLKDIPANREAAFIAHNTPPQAIFLNSTWLYHPASIAGRKIYNGYSFFTWSAGYDTFGREKITKTIYQSEEVQLVCTLLEREQIDYIEVSSDPEDFLLPLSSLWMTYPAFYVNPETNSKIFETKSLCQTGL